MNSDDVDIMMQQLHVLLKRITPDFEDDYAAVRAHKLNRLLVMLEVEE